MKRSLLLPLVCLLLMTLCASAEAPQEPVSIAAPGGLHVTHVVNRPADAPWSDAELLVQHWYAAGDYASAFTLNEQLSALGDAEATYRLGCQYLSGLGVTQDEIAALDCFRMARNAGHQEAALALVLAGFNGWGTPRDAFGAAAELTALAQAGQFQYELALVYLHGIHDLPAHEATAMYWFRQCFGSLEQTDPARYEQQLSAFLGSSADFLTELPAVRHADWDSDSHQAAMALAMGQFWETGRGGVTDAQSARRWYEFVIGLGHEPEATQSHACLAGMHLSGALGEVSVDAAVAHFLQDQSGSGSGAYRAGMLYWDGVTAADGTVLLPQDIQTALTCLSQAAEASHPQACFLLGESFRTGSRVAADPRQAARFYALGLVDSASAECYDPLLAMYQQGLLYDRASMEAIYAGLQRWRGTDHQLIILLAEHWLNGKTAEDGTMLVPQDRRAAFELMEYFHSYHEALHDEPEVFFLNWLGWFYSGNAPEAVARDYARALACYVESANAGNGYAMAMVGVFYHNGRGVAVDHMTARAWYQKAIAAGYAGAQGYLDALNALYPEYPVDQAVTIQAAPGISLSHTVNASHRTSLTDAELLAAASAVQGQWMLALEINRQLAEMGDVEAMYRLGAHYASGLGIQQDDSQAIEWLRKSADAGCSDALFALAAMYLNGWGVPQDAARAAAMLDVSNASEEMRISLASLRTDSAPDEHLLTRPEPVMQDWQRDPALICELAAFFWTQGRGGTIRFDEAIRWYETALLIDPARNSARIPLAELLRDGKSGQYDVQRAIVLFLQAGAPEEAAAMFDAGVTGTDGRLYLAPNAIIAQALRTWSQTPGDPAAAKLLGDLFRDGFIVSANPDLAAAFYWGARDSQYCAEQLAALVEAGLVTDEALLREMGEAAAP